MWHEVDHKKSTCLQNGSWNQKISALRDTISAGKVCVGDSIFLLLSMSTNNHESTTSIDLGITNKFQQVG